MKTKNLPLLLFFLFTFLALAQEQKFTKPNYKKIKKEIKKEKSPFYYPKLFQKFLEGDSIMTIKEKRHLYYGFIFHKKYAPYGGNSYLDSVTDLYRKEKHSPGDLKKIVRFADSVLNKKPFDLRAIYYQIYAYDQLGDQNNFKKKVTQFNTLIEAILSSGDGLSKETAYYVICVSHEYVLLNILGFKFGGGQQLIEHYDYLKLADNEYGIEGLYFDVSASLNHLNKMLKD